MIRSKQDAKTLSYPVQVGILQLQIYSLAHFHP